MPKLVFHDSDGIDKTISLGTEPVTIGRASDCEIQTHDAMVSRKHARVTWDGGYWIEDLGSANGVFLGTEKVEKAAFRPGDVVTCGSLVVRMVPDTKRTPAPQEAVDPPSPRRRPSTPPNQPDAVWNEEIRTTANPALGAKDSKLKAELRREVERREHAEAALLKAEKKASEADEVARELIQLRRRVEQLQAKGGAGGVDLDEVGEAVAVFNDALAELKVSLRAGVDEADALTGPTQSVRVVRESMRSAMDQLEGARERLREMIRVLGLKQG